MAAGDLTTVNKVRTHLGIASSDADAVLQTFVTASSRWMLSQVDRPILSATYTETHDGDDSTRILLDQCPAVADEPPVTVTSVTVDGAAIPQRAAVTAQNPTPDGWVLNGHGVDLIGYRFTRGTRNVSIVYSTGYEASDSATIPAAPGPYTVQASRFFGGDRAVTIAGVAATKVASGPVAGQYTVSASGLYTFAAADASRAAVVTYATVPEDLELAVIEHVALKYRRRDNVGQASGSSDGGSVSYSDASDWRSILDTVDQYRALGIG